MDNLTHALVGAAIAKGGAERTTPLATATLVIAANAPDIDMLAFAGGEYFALAVRRGITHGWTALVVLPFVVTGIMLAWDRWVRRRRSPALEPARPRSVLALSAVGLLTHPSLDWLNTYGMRWGLPFDGTWTYGDALFIIDPWIWLALGGAVFLGSTPARAGTWGWAILAGLTTALVVLGVGGTAAVVWVTWLTLIIARRLRGSGSPRDAGARRRARVGMAVVGLYIGCMIAADLLARRDVFAAAADSGIIAQDVLVAPVRGNPFEADVEVSTADAFVPGSHHWLRSPRVRLRPDDSVPVLSAPGLDASTRTRAVAAAVQREEVADYLIWSRYPYVRVTAVTDGWQVRFADVRYDDQPEAGGLAGLSVHIPRAEIP